MRAPADSQPQAAPTGGEIKPFYRPDIDGLRAVAIIAVVLYHISDRLLPGGFIGVDVFFVISGFLISSLIFKEMDQDGFRFVDFYIRRVRRIFPALILMMATVWLTAKFLFTQNEFLQLGQYIFAGGAFFSNLLQWRVDGYFDTDATLKPLQHLWSLGIEEQFYIVWPITVVLLWKRRFPAWVLVAMALSFAFNIARTPEHATGAFFLPFGRAWELLLGGILAWQDRYGRTVLDRDRVLTAFGGHRLTLKDGASILAIALLAAGLILIHPDLEFPGWWALLPTFSAFLFIWAGETSRLNTKLLANPFMVFVGLISYPLYIWHWPLLSILRIVGNAEPSLTAKFGVVAVSVLLAILTYLFIERPLRHSRLSRAAITAVLVSAMALLCALGAAGYQQKRTAWNATYDCHSFLDPKAVGYEFCRIWGDPSLKKTYVIWGDSHAHSWSAAAATLAKERHARLVEFSHPACPPLIDVHRTTPPTQMGAVCNTTALAAGIMATIEKLRPDRILLAGRWTFYTFGLHEHGDRGTLIGNSFLTTAPEGTATPETSADALRRKLPETIARLARLAPVVVFKTSPTLREPTDVGLARDPLGYEPSLADYRTFEALPNAVIDQATRNIPGVVSFDPAPLFCDARKCHAILNGVHLYEEDNTHISDAGALLALPTLRRLVK